MIEDMFVSFSKKQLAAPLISGQRGEKHSPPCKLKSAKRHAEAGERRIFGFLRLLHKLSILERFSM